MSDAEDAAQPVTMGIRPAKFVVELARRVGQLEAQVESMRHERDMEQEVRIEALERRIEELEASAACPSALSGAIAPDDEVAWAERECSRCGEVGVRSDVGPTRSTRQCIRCGLASEPVPGAIVPPHRQRAADPEPLPGAEAAR